jgi:peptidoglycan/xylan/chitin deacetylase (PgdA/CDA1 family)
LSDRDLRTHVLMYHDVVDDEAAASGFSGPGADRYKLPFALFVAHLDRIAQAVGAPPDVADDLRAGRRGNPSWSLTFDDGGRSAFEVGEELTRRGWRAHFFITTAMTGAQGFLDAAAIKELRGMGHVIGSHSTSHPASMSELTDAELVTEWETSVATLSDLLGEEVDTASVPGGFYTRRVAQAASKAAVRTLFTSEPVRKPRRVDDCLVVGRLSIRRSTTADEAARAAAGRPGPWVRQYAGWNVRKPIKTVFRDGYERARREILARRT